MGEMVNDGNGANVIPFPPVYRIGYSDGEQCGLVEDAYGLTLSFRRFDKAAAALEVIRMQHPELMLWVSWRPNS